MTCKAKQRRRKNRHDSEQFTAIVKTFEKIKSKLGWSAAGKATLNSGQNWESQSGNLTAGVAGLRLNCSYSSWTRVVHPFTVGVSECHP